MFGFIKSKLQKIYSQVTSKISALFAGNTLDENTLKELELILISADTGIKTTRVIIQNLKEKFQNGQLPEGMALKDALEHELLTILQAPQALPQSSIYLMVGINGSGKTTCCAKIAHSLMAHGKKVLLIAADTFRAAATQQLEQWAHKIQCPIITGTPGQDPAAVVFNGMQEYVRNNYDAVIIDTAGRLQTKINLMKELEKIKRVITKVVPNKSITTLLTIDAMLGQNSFEQAKLFNEAAAVNGIVLTKLDGTGKGGIVFGIAYELGIPTAFISFGEHVDQIKAFDAAEYVHDLLHG